MSKFWTKQNLYYEKFLDQVSLFERRDTTRQSTITSFIDIYDMFWLQMLYKPKFKIVSLKLFL